MCIYARDNEQKYDTKKNNKQRNKHQLLNLAVSGARLICFKLCQGVGSGQAFGDCRDRRAKLLTADRESHFLYFWGRESHSLRFLAGPM